MADLDRRAEPKPKPSDGACRKDKTGNTKTHRLNPVRQKRPLPGLSWPAAAAKIVRRWTKDLAKAKFARPVGQCRAAVRWGFGLADKHLAASRHWCRISDSIRSQREVSGRLGNQQDQQDDGVYGVASVLVCVLRAGFLYDRRRGAGPKRRRSRSPAGQEAAG